MGINYLSLKSSQSTDTSSSKTIFKIMFRITPVVGQRFRSVAIDGTRSDVYVEIVVLPDPTDRGAPHGLLRIVSDRQAHDVRFRIHEDGCRLVAWNARGVLGVDDLEFFHIVAYQPVLAWVLN